MFIHGVVVLMEDWGMDMKNICKIHFFSDNMINFQDWKLVNVLKLQKSDFFRISFVRNVPTKINFPDGSVFIRDVRCSDDGTVYIADTGTVFACGR